jgi:hypothetical protein
MKAFSFSKSITALIAILIVSVVALAQNSTSPQPPPSLAGKYQGNAKGSQGDVKVTLELVDEAGKLSGQITSPNAVYKIVKAELAAGVLTLDAEGTNTKGKMTLKHDGDKLVGDFTAGGNTGPVELKKVVGDEITGEWDAVADTQGQAFPFLLTLKLEGDKVSGSSSSQLGNTPITSGTWKDGKLTIVMDAGQGQIGLVATMVEGKLSGDYDYAGQLSGKWVAIRKK